MPLVDLRPEPGQRGQWTCPNSYSSLPGSHTDPLPELHRPALTTAGRGRPLPVLPLAPPALSPKCVSFPLCPGPLLTVLVTSWGLLATDQPTHSTSRASRRAPTAPQTPTKAPLSDPRPPSGSGALCCPLQQRLALTHGPQFPSGGAAQPTTPAPKDPVTSTPNQMLQWVPPSAAMFLPLGFGESTLVLPCLRLPLLGLSSSPQEPLHAQDSVRGLLPLPLPRASHLIFWCKKK